MKLLAYETRRTFVVSLSKQRTGPKTADVSLRQWVSDELAERGTADERFRVLMDGLPRVATPAGFEADVIARIGLTQTTAGLSSRVPRLVARAAFFVLAVLVTGYGATALAPWVASQFVAFLNFGARGFVSVVQAADGGLDAWTILARVGRTIGSAFASPRVLLPRG